MNFPTYAAVALLIESTGIGPGKISGTGDIVTYTVTNPVNVPANTNIRIQLANINNPQSPGNFAITITTKNAANVMIDGPTDSTAYSIKQIGTSDVADLSITNPKLADDAVTSSKLDDNAVTTPKLADGSVTSDKLAFDVDPPRTATLVLKKIVVNPLESVPVTAADFTIHVNGNNPSPTDFPGSPTGVTVFMAPGPYAVTEEFANHPPISNYGTFLQSFSQDCVGTINDGQTKECIVTNTRV